VSGIGWPARYEVRVEGVLDGRWSEWFEGLQLQNQSGETILSARCPISRPCTGSSTKCAISASPSSLCGGCRPSSRANSRNEAHPHPTADEPAGTVLTTPRAAHGSHTMPPISPAHPGVRDMVEIQVLMNTTVHEGLEHRTAFDAPSARRIQ
jgi:hypothetical protein